MKLREAEVQQASFFPVLARQQRALQLAPALASLFRFAVTVAANAAGLTHILFISQHLSHLGRQVRQRKWLPDEMYASIKCTVVGDQASRVSRHGPAL